MHLQIVELNDANGLTLAGAAITSKDDDTDDEDVVSPEYLRRANLVFSASSVSSGYQPTSSDEPLRPQI